MERDLWRRIVTALRSVPRRCPRNAVYDNRQVLAVYLWAALHDRPVSWACRRENWPLQAWRRSLPDQSTMSRRLRDDQFQEDLSRLIERLQCSLPPGRLLLVDGKAYPVPKQSRDREARLGWASNGHKKGYKLHLIVNEHDRVLGWELHPMNKAECIVAQSILDRTGHGTPARLLVGDASYDSNQLHAVAAQHGIRLIAPRRKPGTGLRRYRNKPGRIRAAQFTEQRGGWMWKFLRRARWAIERFYAAFTVFGGGAATLPPWIRGLRRARLWIGAKLAINAARIALLRGLHA